MGQKSPLILLVDDEQIILDVISSLLREKNYNTLTAESPKEAFKILEYDTPDLILSDIVMPGMTGFEFYEKLQEIPHLQHIPFVFLTALGSEDDINRGKAMGVDDYLLKPVSSTALFSVIQGKLVRSARIKIALEKQRSQIRDEIINILSHELRTPLTKIQGASDILTDYYKELSSEEIEEFLDALRSGSSRLNRLIRDAIKVAEIPSLVKEDILSRQVIVSVKLLLTEIMQGFPQRCIKNNIQFHVELPDDYPKIKTYPDHFKEIIARILDNAVKFTNQGGNVTVKLNTTDKFVEIQIINTGRGIPKESIPKIFSKFYQHQRANYEQQGMGMGLFITKAYAELNEISIHCESIPEEKTIFKIQIPHIH